MTSFGTWLAEIGLGRYDAVFAADGIDFDVIRSLSDADLRELGLTLGDRKRLLQAVARLDEQHPDPVIPAVASAMPSEPLRDDAGGERRQLTVMFCDLVGSTALSEKLDPEELRSLLHAYRTLCGDVIARYDGFVARYVGDGILTYFGWPAAHEEDAERAVRTALEIVHTVKRASTTENLSVRIGIATGSVVVGEAAGVGDQSKLAVGSTPNLAARLQGLAAADQIVIAASTRRLVGNAFELADLGERDLKGIAEPVHVWRVERALVTGSRFDANRGGGALTPLVGRGEELDLLLRRWSQAQDGEGQVVVLSGEPGIGKSRILGALRQRLEAQGVQALRFQCSPYYVNSAFWPIIDNLERALKLTRDETADAKLDKLEALVVTQYGRPMADVRFVASILSIPCDQRYGTLPMTPQKHKDETFRTLADITEAGARQQPSVMLFEDAHWADPTTLEVLDLLIDRVKSVSLLVVLTHRPEFQSRWSGQGHVGTLNLSKLTRAQSAAIVSALGGGKALPEALHEQILTRTDGVPLFVEELTKSILESGELKDAGDHYEYGGSARAVSIPATLRDSLMARLDRFMPVKEIAQIGAAIGREFSYELIAAVAPMPQAQLDDALARLSESGLAFRRGTPPDAVYTFKHALVQDAAYDSLLKSRRQELHGKIARVIEQRFPNIKTTEPELLAHHFTEADVPDHAIRYWLKAGQQALGLSGMVEGATLLGKGLSLIATVPDSLPRQEHELDLQIGLGQAIIATQGYAAPAVNQAFARARELCERLGCEHKLLPILYGQWAYCSVADLIQAHELAVEIQHFSEVQDNAVVRMMSCRASGLTHLLRGDFAVARAYLEQGLSLYDTRQQSLYASIYATTDPLIFFQSYLSLTLVCCGQLDRARSRSESALAYARSLSHAHSLGFALHWTWVACRWARSEPTALLLKADELIALSDKRSFVMWRALGLAFRGWCLTALGQPDQGILLMSAGLAEVRASGTLFVPHVLTLCADAHRMAGQPHTALAYVTEAEQFAETTQCKWLQAETFRLRGDLMLIVGNPAGAEASFLDAITLAERQGARLFQLRASTSLALLWRDQGKRTEARDLLASIYHWFTEGFDAPDLKDARALLDELA
jgi:class 3 adenylate cyclase/tetratricopeptide (TPR) repeat protein